MFTNTFNFIRFSFNLFFIQFKILVLLFILVLKKLF